MSAQIRTPQNFNPPKVFGPLQWVFRTKTGTRIGYFTSLYVVFSTQTGPCAPGWVVIVLRVADRGAKLYALVLGKMTLRMPVLSENTKYNDKKWCIFYPRVLRIFAPFTRAVRFGGAPRGGVTSTPLGSIIYIYIYTPHLALYWWIFFALEASGRIIFALKVSYFIADTGT